MHKDQHYTLNTASIYLNVMPKVVKWLQSRQIRSFDQLTLQHLKAAWCYFQSRHAATSAAVCILERFLRLQGTVPEGQIPTLAPMDVEIANFADYLCETRGFAQKTILGHSRISRAFLKFLHFDRRPSQLQDLQPRQIEGFLCQSARTNNRFSLQHIVATVRAFLKWRHARGLLSRPLHLQIDTPRVYRGERLPRALPQDQVKAILKSIDQSKSPGQRDFALLYLAAAYGLRSGELVRLTLDDIDWQGRTLRVVQTKTRQTLQLPLTDEAANVLIRYLRQTRPTSTHRQLFLHANAPYSPIGSTAVRQVLTRRIQYSGLNIPSCGTNALRHSFAMRLLQQGVAVKTIGDAMGHRNIESTAVYLRLDVKTLGEVCLPVPVTVQSGLVKLVAASSVPRIRVHRPSHNLPDHFHSRLASSLQRYVNLKRALGRKWKKEGSVLAHWDDFVYRNYPKTNLVRGEIFTAWTTKLAHQSSNETLHCQQIVRNFLLFHARDHSGTFIPDPLTFPKPVPVAPPRLISETEMGRVMDATRLLPPTPTNPLRAETFRLGLILLYCCGLRQGELLRLRLSDIEAERTVLQVRLTKFYKSRLVPLSPTVTAELQQYLEERELNKLPMAPETFLMWSGHRSSEVYSSMNLLTVWHQLCVSVQVFTAQGHPPRLHDLRHSFAVNALQRWYAQGTDVQSKLIHLATYMGHACPASTHYYLKLTPELRQAASQRFHQQFGSLFTLGGRA